MPQYTPPKTSLPGQLCLGIFCVVMVACLVSIVMKCPYILLLIPFGIYSVHNEEIKYKKQLLTLAGQRRGDDIGTFARQFNYRTIDTWVIRAVYEQFQKYLSDTVPAFPLYAEDKIYQCLLIDEDDFDMDIIEEIAQRTGRSLENSAMEQNPYYQKIGGMETTLRDVVLFFNAQPKTA